MELYGNSDYGSESSVSEVDIVSPLESSQISNSTTSRKRLYSDVWNYFTVHNHNVTCRCGSGFTYKEDGATDSSFLNRHLRTCIVKNDNKQACILYDSYSNSYQVRSMKSLVELIVGGRRYPFASLTILD